MRSPRAWVGNPLPFQRSNVKRSALRIEGNDHLIEFNDIHHIALETGDVGAIYTGRDWTYRGNKIRFNFIHETGGVGMGSMGVYMDDCVSGTEIYGNIFFKVQRAAFLGGGRDVEPRLGDRGEIAQLVQFHAVILCERRRFAA